MAKNKQMDVDGDGSGGGSRGASEPKRKNRGSSGANRTNENGYSDRNQRDESAKILDLGTYTDAANTVIQTMSATQDAVKNLAQQYKTRQGD